MLPDDAFLRRLPTILNPAQVVELEALIFSADAVETSMDVIRQVTTHYREKIGEAKRNVIVGLFIHAWTTVDSVHVVRQVLNALDYKTPQALTFVNKYESARVLRTNAQNVGTSKGRPPIFGVLGYVCVPEDKLTEKDGKTVVTGGMTVALTTGRFITPGGRFSIVNPAARRLFGPVGGFRLEAFGEFLELEELESDLRALMAEVNDRLGEQALAIASQISKERDLAIETLMSNPPERVALLLAFNSAE